jgi:hypothetical protein
MQTIEETFFAIRKTKEKNARNNYPRTPLRQIDVNVCVLPKPIPRTVWLSPFMHGFAHTALCQFDPGWHLFLCLLFLHETFAVDLVSARI